MIPCPAPDPAPAAIEKSSGQSSKAEKQTQPVQTPKSSKYVLQPYAAFEQDYTHGRRIREHGAQCLNLSIKKKNVSSDSFYLGTHVSASPVSYLIFNGDIAWRRRFGSQGTTNKTRFVDFANPFKIYGSRQGANGLVGIAEVLGVLSDTAEINLAVAGEKWKRWSAYQASAGLNIKF